MCSSILFLFICFLFYRTYDGSWSQYLYKIKRRFWSLLIPYIIFGTIGYVKVRLFSPSEMEGGGISYLSSLWLSNTMPLWFIRELIAFTIFAPLIWHIKKFDLDECTNQFNINMLNIFKYCQSKKFSLLDAFIFIRSYAKQKHDNMYCKKI